MVVGMWWYNQTLAWRKIVEAYSNAARTVAQAVVLKQRHDGNAVTAEIAPRRSEILGRAMTVSRATEYAAYLQAANDQFGWAPTRPVAPGINVWLEAGLKGGIRCLSWRRSGNKIYGNAESYYEVYFHVVDGIAGQLYVMVAAARGPALDEIPADLLGAANRMAAEITDIFYRSGMSSVVQRGTSGTPGQ